MNLTKNERFLYYGSKSKLVAHLILNQKTGDVTYYSEIDCPESIADDIMAVVNHDGFMDRYKEEYIIPILTKKLRDSSRMKVYTVSEYVPIGKLFFAMTLILNHKNIPYTLEEHQKMVLLSVSQKLALKWSRRLSKSFTMKIDALYHSIFTPPCSCLFMAQSKDVAIDLLQDVEEWCRRNSLLYKFSGGTPQGSMKRRWSQTDKYFQNGSRLSCRTSTNPALLRGKGVNRLYEDEKAHYRISDRESAELGILRMGQDVDLRDTQFHAVTSTPNGIHNPFEDLFNSDDYYSSLIEICEEIKWNEETKKPTDFVNIRTNRITKKDLLSEYDRLGYELFMQEYMCQPASFEGAALDEFTIEQFFDREKNREDTNTEERIDLSFDLGKSVGHRSVATLGVMREGRLHFINHHEYPVGCPFLTKGDQQGVFNHIVDDLIDRYNIQRIVGDATGLGTEEYQDYLVQLLAERGLRPEVIPYKWSRDSKYYLGKSKLFYSLVKPSLESKKVVSYYDHELYNQMRSWRAKETASGGVTLTAKSGADDKWTSVMQLVWLNFGTLRIGDDRKPSLVPSITNRSKEAQHRERRARLKVIRKRREPYGE